MSLLHNRRGSLKHVQSVKKRRGDGPIRLQADNLCTAPPRILPLEVENLFYDVPDPHIEFDESHLIERSIGL